MHDAQRTTDDGHPVTLKAPLEHVVLRWAKNIAYFHNQWKYSVFVKVVLKGDN